MIPKKFCTKLDIVEAIQFEYTKDGISALKEFMEDKATIVTIKDRHPDAVGTAYIDIPGGFANAVLEGYWIGKTQRGEFFFYSDTKFKETYQEYK